MNYLSVCSGIEAATVAWHGLGWNPVAFSEIEKFPSEVLAYHYPTVPNLGDMTKFHEWPQLDINLLVGGTPCQAFSVAGLRQGLADPRGNLTLTFLGVAAKYKPEWIVWENVPGVLSSVTTDHPDTMAAPDDLQEGEERECVENYEADSSHALSCFLEGLQKLGYGCALRCFDAQYFGLAQRRKRVFVVGCLGDWARAAAVLFEPESVCGNNPPSRKPRQNVAGTISSRATGGGGLGTDFDLAGGIVADDRLGGVTHSLRADGFDASKDGTGRGTPLVPVWPAEIAPTLSAHFGDKQGLEDQHALNGGGYLSPLPPVSLCLNAGAMGRIDWESETLIPTRQGGFPSDPIAIQERAICENPMAGPDGIGVRTDGLAYTLEARQVPQAIAFSCKDYAADAGEVSPTLRSMGHANSHPNAGGQVAVAFNWNAQADQMNFDPNTTPALTCSQGAAVGPVALALRGREGGATAELGDDKAFALRASSGGGDKPHMLLDMAVRRLTPMECERLQGFPDHWTMIPRGKKPAHMCPDGPRYKALGNSMAVPCMKWIGRRIHAQRRPSLLLDID